MTSLYRASETARLQEIYNSQKAELFVVYGRRRLGKAELLRHFCQDRPHIFYAATPTSTKNQLSAWSQTLWRHRYGAVTSDFTFPSWEVSFRFLSHHPATERLVVIIDEFPYMIEGNSALPAILRQIWDEMLHKTRLMLVLCGSSVSLMEQAVLSVESPLHDRITGQLYLQRLDFQATRQFCPGYDVQTQVEGYAILGGAPAYWEQFDVSQPLSTNVVQHVLTPNRFLYEEPIFLLRSEVHEPRHYYAVLQAIANGNARPTAISQASGVGDPRSISKYLAALQELRLVERQAPITEEYPEKSRQGLYRLDDNFMRFWFRFLAPVRSLLDQGQGQMVWETHIAPHLGHFVEPIFKQVCQQFLWRASLDGRFPFQPQQIGPWWQQNAADVDLVALHPTDRTVAVVACQWRNAPLGHDALKQLRHKATDLVSDLKALTVYYVLCARAGFTEELKTQATHDPMILLYDLETLASPHI